MSIPVPPSDHQRGAASHVIAMHIEVTSDNPANPVSDLEMFQFLRCRLGKIPGHYSDIEAWKSIQRLKQRHDSWQQCSAGSSQLGSEKGSVSPSQAATIDLRRRNSISLQQLHHQAAIRAA